MEPFAYLSVLISIVLAMSVMHLLSAIVRLIHNRSRTMLYWPSLVYVFILFVVIIQTWWADFQLSDHTHWTFMAFASTLLIPADLYLLCALLLPSADFPSTDDMQKAYYFNRAWFFSALLALPLLSFLEQMAVDGHISGPADTTFKLVFAALIIVSIFNKSEVVQKSLAVIGAILVVLYVSMLFNSLN
jgi:hypothetical protein